ncbi:MAG: TonB family protein [Myxococcota bacterium]
MQPLIIFSALALAQQARLPEVVYAAPAAYPPDALAAGVEAVVPLQLVISDEGQVIDAAVTEPVGDGFDESALLAVRAFRFSPAIDEAGQPAIATIRYNFAFTVEAAPTLSVEGQIIEAGVRSPLSGAKISAAGPEGLTAYAEADRDGRFSLVGLADGPWILSATAPGLQRQTETLSVTTGAVTAITLYLVRDSRETALLADEELVIESDRASSEISERRLRAEEIRYLPGSNGDVVKVVQNLPGVARAPLGIGQLIIRGTAPEDSRYFIDGTPIPLVFHFAGLTSILPSDAIEEVAYLPGNYSVRYGRILGGLVDLRTDPALPERSGGYLSVDVYQSAVFIEQVLGDKTGMTFSGRRSYIDAVLSPLLSSTDGPTIQAPRYYDGQLRLLHEADSGADWDVLLFASDDRFRFLGAEEETLAAFADQFQRLRIRRTKDHGDWEQESALSLGPERRFFEFGGQDSDALEQRLTVAAREEWTRPLSPEQSLGLRGGLDIQGGQDAFRFFAENINPLEEGESLFIAPAAYAEVAARVGPVTLIPGLRGDLLAYDTGYLAGAVDPRLAARLTATQSTVIKGSFGRFSSFPTLRQLDDRADGTGSLTAAHSLQSSLGVEQQLSGRTRAEVTGFYNSLSDLVVGREDRLRFFTGPPPAGPFDTDPYANDGVGRVYGIESQVRYEGPTSVGLLTMTLSHSERQDRSDEPVELFLYDQPVVINALWSQQLPRNWRLGARLRLGSGNPYTPVVNRFYNTSSRSYVPVYGERSSARLPTAYSVDIRVDKSYTFKRWSLQTYLDLQNATFAKNVEVIAWNYDYSEETPIISNPPLPVFGLRGEW